MQRAYFLFHDQLNDFLPRARRSTVIAHSFDWRASVKDMIESLGVPHAEIEAIVVNGQPVDFAYIVAPDDSISVYPADGTGTPPALPLRPPFAGQPRFVLDTHLGRLAAYLRMMGFDTLYRNNYDDDELAQVSSSDTRILLTRDVGLLKRSIVTYGSFVRATNPYQQLIEVVRRYNLGTWKVLSRRCLKCNGQLELVAKSDVVHLLPQNTARYYDVFHRCQLCGQVYWKGPHYMRMQAFIAQALETA